MVRKIIKIHEEACNGCGICAEACHEGAIQMVNGKAKLTREDYCDGLGDCLPGCPTGAITFEVREAPAYDEDAVLRAKQAAQAPVHPYSHAMHTCPGSMSRSICHQPMEQTDPAASCLNQWPVQLKLVPVRAPYYQGAHLLVAADCTAYAYGNFHQEFMNDHITIIGCPKLDDVDYRDKLTQILMANDIRSLTVTRMEVPCCGGLESAAKSALLASGKRIPWNVVTFSADGRILDR